jgi:hypothetical protein
MAWKSVDVIEIELSLFFNVNVSSIRRLQQLRWCSSSSD